MCLFSRKANLSPYDENREQLRPAGYVPLVSGKLLLVFIARYYNSQLKGRSSSSTTGFECCSDTDVLG
jgi:hypothetical protein